MKALKWVSILSVAAVVSAVAAVAHADDAERRFRAQNQLNKQVKKIEEECGFKMAADIDFDSFAPEVQTRYSLGGWCDEPLEAIERLCRGPKTKAYLAKVVKSYKCVQAKGERKITIDKGVITLHLNFESSNYGEFSRRELVRQL